MDQCLGKSGIAELLPEICAHAGVLRRTNHAMRRTAISAMYAAGIPEHEIQRRTRHKSLEALRKYHK